MAYQEWSVVYGEQPTAAKWNILGTNCASFNDGTGIADDAIVPDHILNDYKFSAYLSGDYTLVSGNTVPFNSEHFDTGSDYNNATYKYVVPITGYYKVGLLAVINPLAAAKYARVALYKGGVLESYLYQVQNQSASAVAFHGSGEVLVYLTAGDELEIKNTTNDAACKLTSGASGSRFYAHLLST